MKQLRQFIDTNFCLSLLVSLLYINQVHSQDVAKVINVKAGYAVINRGTTNGIKEGDIFKIQTPDKDFQFGQIQVIKAKPTISAVKLTSSVSGYSLKVGDVVVLSEEQIVDELLNETPQDLIEQQRRRNTHEPRFHTDRTARSIDSNERMRIEMRLEGLRTRKLLDFIGLFITYGITVAGDYAVGNDVFWGSPIPVIGPFINMALIDESNDLYPARDRLLFATSGVVQTFLFVDLLMNSAKMNRLNKQLQLGYNPKSGRIELALSF